MATPAEIKAAARKLEEIPKALDICEQVGKALVETGQEWRSEDRMPQTGWQLPPTDYERARDKAIGDLNAAESDLLKIRDSELSPDAIRATAHVLKLKMACEQCPEINRESLEEGKAFTCMAREESTNASHAFHFKLDAKGDIVESR